MLLKNNVKITTSTSVDLNLKDENLLKKFIAIDGYVIKNEQYLNPLFGLNDLAEVMNISSSQASKLINNCSGYNFSDYINNLRVEYAKKLLSDEQYNKYTMVALALECGFNSKSTFYKAFKKFTNKTPTEFKEI